MSACQPTQRGFVIQRLRSACATALLGLLATGGHASPPEEAPVTLIPVPGGKAAVSEFLGYVRQENDFFVESLVRVLLTTTHQEHTWDQVPLRLELVRYLDVLDDLERKLGGSISLEGGTKAGRRSFERLAGHLGYKARFRRGSVDLTPKEGEEEALRRRVATALGWDLQEIAGELDRGEDRTLAIVTDEVPLPISLQKLQGATGRTVHTGEVLELLAKDQRLCLLLEGLRQLGPDGAALVSRQVGLRWLYRKAPMELYRYGAAIEIRGEELILPGGEETRALWSELAGAPVGITGKFLMELLTTRNGRVAHLWKAMRFAPGPSARYYMGTGESAATEENRYLKRLFYGLDNAAFLDFDGPRSDPLGFDAVVRSVPLTEDGGHLRLPGGTGLWYQAIKGDDLPDGRNALTRAIARGNRRDLNEGEFLLRVLREKVDMGPYSKPVLPRLVRTSNIFLDRTELLTPQNVVTISRALERYPGAFSLLDSFPFRDPSTPASYLETVEHLASLPDGVEKERLLTTFQGGIQWIRLLAQAGKVPVTALESLLQEWIRLHGRVDSPRVAARAQAAWLEALLNTLPEVGGSAPGRTEAERRWLNAVVQAEDPQRFSWAGLDYQGHRGADLTRAMAFHLENQRIPTADSIVALATGVERLAESARKGDVEASRDLVERVRSRLGSLPAPESETLSGIGDVAERTLPLGRFEILKLLQEVETRRGRRLQHLADDLDRAVGSLAHDLREVFLAPIYVTAMGEEKSVLFNDPNLIRKHLLTEHVNAQARAENHWQRSSISRQGPLGTHVVGHVGSVPFALAEFHLAERRRRQQQRSDTLLRDRAWFEDLLTTPWQELTPDLDELISLLHDAGASVMEMATASIGHGGSESLDFVVARVPYARLSRSAKEGDRVAGASPSELFLVGLGAMAGDAWGPAKPHLVSSESQSRFNELTAALGPHWRDHLDVVGASTVEMDGTGRRDVGPWPPYEALDKQRTPDAVWQRQLLDLRVALLAATGRHRLPGRVAADIMPLVLVDVAEELRLETQLDWQSYLRWINGLDDRYFEEKLRQCLRDGLYEVAL